MRFFLLLAVIYLAVMTPGLLAQTTQPVDIVHSARTAIEQLEKADYASVETMFSAKLRDRFPEPKLRQTWEGLHRKAGRLQSMGEPVSRVKDNLRRVVVPAQFEKSKMEIEFVFNSDGQIVGLLLNRK